MNIKRGHSQEHEEGAFHCDHEKGAAQATEGAAVVTESCSNYKYFFSVISSMLGN